MLLRCYVTYDHASKACCYCCCCCCCCQSCCDRFYYVFMLLFSGFVPHLLRSNQNSRMASRKPTQINSWLLIGLIFTRECVNRIPSSNSSNYVFTFFHAPWTSSSLASQNVVEGHRRNVRKKRCFLAVFGRIIRQVWLYSSFLFLRKTSAV